MLTGRSKKGGGKRTMKNYVQEVQRGEKIGGAAIY